MPYIGNTIRAADDYRLIDDISSSFNGSTTSFALQVAGSAPVPFPKSPQQVLISVNGVIQEPDPTGSSGFNLVGTNIVFSSAPTNGHAFFGIIYATADYLNAGGNFPSGSLGAPSFTFIGDENTGLYRKSGGSVGFVSDATEIANFDSNGITISSGNLIIPDSITHSGDTNTKIRFPATDTVTVETGGTERLKVDSNGRLAISLSTARASGGVSGMLQVERADGNGAINIVQNQNNAAGSPSLVLAKSRGTSVGSNTVVANNDTLGAVKFVGADGTDLNTPAAEIVGQVDGTPGSNDMPGRLVFSTTADGASSLTERMRINSSGNVGIGTTSPSTPLHVVGTIHGSTNIGIRTTSPANNLHVHQDDSDKSIAQFTNTTTGSASGDGFHIGITSNEDANLNMKESKSILFKTADTERMRLSAAGRLGLGNDSPDARLSVKDTSTFTAYASAVPSVGACMQQLQNSPSSEAINNHSSIQFGVNGGTHNRVNSISAVAESASNRKLAFTFCTDSGSNRSERLRISADGHVLPGADSTYDIGSNGNRFANGYFDTLYGDGSNLTGITTAISSIANDGANRLLTSDGDGTATAHQDFNVANQRLTCRNTSSGTTYPLFLQNRTNSDSRVGIQMIATGSDLSDGQFASIEARGQLAGNTSHALFFKTCTSGGTPTDRLNIDINGHTLPGADNTYNLGSSSVRWANVFTTDLHLSNKGSQNDVDSTWGDYTIQEGYADLYLINNRTGKRFKFNLTEVS